MAAKILTGEANISEMPIEYFPDPVKKYNPRDLRGSRHHGSGGLRRDRLIFGNIKK